MMIRRTRPRRRGLSLLEVLLALTVLVLSLTAIGQLVDAGTARGNQARATIRGTRLAQSKLAEVEAGLISVASETGGTFDGDDAAWSYKITPEPAGPPNLYNVTVIVSRDIEGRQFELVVTQIIFDPTLMGSAAQAERPAPPDDSTTPATGGTSP